MSLKVIGHNRKFFKFFYRSLLVLGLVAGTLSFMSPFQAEAGIITNSQGNSQVIDSGSEFSCSLMNGDIYCLGANDKGQLGNGTLINSSTPVKAIGISGKVTNLALGDNHACAVVNYNELYCWGDNSNGELGLGSNKTNSYYSTPQKVDFFSHPSISMLSLGSGFSYAVGVDGKTLWSWGLNDKGQLGDGTNTSRNFPEIVNKFQNEKISLISSGWDHTCVTTNAKETFCTGGNEYGQLGLNNTTNSSNFEEIVQFKNSSVNKMALGKDYSCVNTDANLFCFGLNDKGQLGIGNTENSLIPAAVPGIDSSLVSLLAVSNGTTCVDLGSEMKCWGSNNLSQSNPLVCNPGDVLSGNTCINTYNADVQEGAYYCSEGGTMNGTSTCTRTYSASYSSGYYYCNSGWNLDGSTCWKQGSVIDLAGSPYCDSGWYMSGQMCYKDYPASYTVSCSQGSWNGSNCIVTTSKVGGKCPSGYRAGPPGDCYTGNSAWIQYSYYCAQGGNKNGTTCTMHKPVSYTPDVHSCSGRWVGPTSNNANCHDETSANYSSGYYSCPQGGSLSSTTCTKTYATSKYPNTYSCPVSGDTIVQTTKCQHLIPMEVEESYYNSPNTINLPANYGVNSITGGNDFTCINMKTTVSSNNTYCVGNNDSSQIGQNSPNDYSYALRETFGTTDLYPNASAPSSPLNSSATLGDRKITVSWEAPYNDGGNEVTSYTIIDSAHNISETVPNDQFSIDIENLEFGTNYVFSIYATNGIGNSPSVILPSITAVATPDAPTNLNVISGNSQIDLTWDAPSSNGSSITKYIVTAYENGNAVLSKESIINSLTFDGLENGIEYQFAVQAVNQIGISESSSLSEEITPHTTPSKINDYDTVRAGNKITFHWSAPFDGGSPILGYKLTNALTNEEIVLSPEETSYVWVGLDRDETHIFELTAFNIDGESESRIIISSPDDDTQPSNVYSDGSEVNVDIDSTISLALSDDYVKLEGEPYQSDVTETDNTMIYNVKSNNIAGYNVSISPDQSDLVSNKNNNSDVIPMDLINVSQDNSNFGINDTASTSLENSVTLINSSERTPESGNDMTTEFSITEMPFVNADDYTGTVTYTVTNN